MRSSDYQMMFSDQSGKCSICGYSPPKGERLFIDHDHESGEVRGLLCRECNSGLGFFKDSTELLQKAIQYILTGGDKSRFRVEGGKLLELSDTFISESCK